MVHKNPVHKWMAMREIGNASGKVRKGSDPSPQRSNVLPHSSLWLMRPRNVATAGKAGAGKRRRIGCQWGRLLRKGTDVSIKTENRSLFPIVVIEGECPVILPCHHSVAISFNHAEFDMVLWTRTIYKTRGNGRKESKKWYWESDAASDGAAINAKRYYHECEHVDFRCVQYGHGLSSSFVRSTIGGGIFQAV